MSKPKSVEIPELIKTNFGDTVEDILAKKGEENQTRSHVSKALGRISMTADECKKLCKAANIVYKDGYEGRVIGWVGSDEGVDRDGDIIRQSGWDLKNYKKNSVVMFSHITRDLPIGYSIQTWVSDKELKFWVLFPDKDTFEFADTVFKMAEAGFLKGSSVGFGGKEIAQLSPEQKLELGMGPWGVEFIKQELFEFSITPIGSNPNTLQEAVSKGIFSKKELTEFVSKEILENIKDESEVEEKAGAVLSKKNITKVNATIDKLSTAIDSLKQLLADAEPEKPEEEVPKKLDSQSIKDILTLSPDLLDIEDDEADEKPGIYNDVKTFDAGSILKL